MNKGAAILILLAYPAACLIQDPAALRWAATHRGSLMPGEVQLSLEKNGRRLYFVKYLVVAFLIWVWGRISGLQFRTLAPHPDPVHHIGRIAFACAALLAIGRLGFLSYFRRVTTTLPNHPFIRG